MPRNCPVPASPRNRLATRAQFSPSGQLQEVQVGIEADGDTAPLVIGALLIGFGLGVAFAMKN